MVTYMIEQQIAGDWYRLEGGSPEWGDATERMRNLKLVFPASTYRIVTVNLPGVKGFKPKGNQ